MLKHEIQKRPLFGVEGGSPLSRGETDLAGIPGALPDEVRHEPRPRDAGTVINTAPRRSACQETAQGCQRGRIWKNLPALVEVMMARNCEPGTIVCMVAFVSRVKTPGTVGADQSS